MSQIKKVEDKPNFPAIEERINDFWKKNNIFQKSIDQRSDDQQYKFVDGPPFVTGMPHYGSLLPSIAKDVIPRYWTMKGKKVRRVWGWDCHGIQIEEKINKKLNVRSRDDIENKIGIESYIEACQEFIRTCTSDWRWYIEKIGRWVDMDNAYYTMNTNYMESVIWGFKQIYDKGLIYKGKRTSLYSTDTMTPVSNFEVAMDQDNYRDVDDLSVFVKFKISKFTNEELRKTTDKDIYMLAWTTTPWTIPSNFALAVNKDATYSLVEFNGEFFILAKDRLGYTFNVTENEIGNESDKTVRLIKEVKGEELKGNEYIPVYTYFKDQTNNNDYKVYVSPEVVLTEGTGVLHIAPAFGEVDFEMGKEFGLSIFSDIDEEGKMNVGNFIGTYLRDASPLLAEEMEKMGNLFRSEIYNHRLPFYRGDNPLIYVTQDSYFINVQKIKDRMLELNMDINWVPDHIKNGRFAKTVETSPDWCISRNRYWATIMPIWISEDKSDEIIIGSIEEIAKYTDQLTKKEENGKDVYYFENKPFDLHKHICDKIVLTKNGKKYYRIAEVLDCWMDSGSVPFAEYHYPFENKEIFEKSISADYIIEYVGQVRAWFNVLLRMSTIIFDDTSFKNVVCTGVLAGNDGRKMSKSYGNYPDPKEVLENIGGEALRLYMMNSPIMVGDDMNWSDELLKDQIKNILLPIWNTYKYLSIYANLADWNPIDTTYPKSNILDRWIKEYMNKITLEYSKQIESYNIPASVKLIQEAIDNISSWYIRRSRDRFAKKDPEALQSLFAALVQFAKTFAPQMPFLTEEIFQNLVVNTKLKDSKESIHLELFPQINDYDESLLKDMEQVRQICSLGQSIRVTNGLKVRQPLAKAYVQIEDPELQSIIKDELNVKEVVFRKAPLEGNGLITLTNQIEENNQFFVTLDTNISDELKEEGIVKDFVRHIQNIRKMKRMKMDEKADIIFYTNDTYLKDVIIRNSTNILSHLAAEHIDYNELEKGDKIKIENIDILIELKSF